jgi:hypothetical protein
MSVKSKPSISIKLDDRYKAILEIAVKKMKADGIQSATKTDVVRQALELYAKEKQISNDIIHRKLNNTKQNTVDVVSEKKFTAKDLLKYSGTWAGGKEDAEKVLKYIIENRTEA